LVAGVAALASLLGLLKGPVYAALGPVLILLWVADYLFPVTYRLTEEGLFLRPLPRPSRLDAYRGVLLRRIPPRAEELIRERARRARWVG